MFRITSIPKVRRWDPQIFVLPMPTVVTWLQEDRWSVEIEVCKLRCERVRVRALHVEQKIDIVDTFVLKLKMHLFVCALPNCVHTRHAVFGVELYD